MGHEPLDDATLRHPSTFPTAGGISAGMPPLKPTHLTTPGPMRCVYDLILTPLDCLFRANHDIRLATFLGAKTNDSTRSTSLGHEITLFARVPPSVSASGGGSMAGDRQQWKDG